MCCRGIGGSGGHDVVGDKVRTDELGGGMQEGTLKRGGGRTGEGAFEAQCGIEGDNR